MRRRAHCQSSTARPASSRSTGSTTTTPIYCSVDTGVVVDAPTPFFHSGIADGLATWFEAATYWSDGDNVVGGKATRAGHQLARLCYETLRDHSLAAVDAVERGAVTESVEAVTEANTLVSGLGFESGVWRRPTRSTTD